MHCSGGREGGHSPRFDIARRRKRSWLAFVAPCGKKVGPPALASKSHRGLFEEPSLPPSLPPPPSFSRNTHRNEGEHCVSRRVENGVSCPVFVKIKKEGIKVEEKEELIYFPKAASYGG